MPKPFAQRFRGFLPVVIDVETGGFNPQTDALLEVAAVFLGQDDKGLIQPTESFHQHINPFTGANIEKAAIDFIGMDPSHPFRFAINEDQALEDLYKRVRQEMKKNNCHRSVLVGHNAAFDLSFLLAANERIKFKRNPFHHFTTFDTACLSAVLYGQTVLARAYQAAGFSFDQSQAHSAIYDASCTAQLFCHIVNQCHLKGLSPSKKHS